MTPKRELAQEILKSHKEVAFYLDKVIQQLDPEKVILFGSKATGSATNFSDTDIAVVGVKHFDTTEIFGAVDIVEYEKVPQSLQEKIQKEGIVLYEKGQGKAA